MSVFTLESKGIKFNSASDIEPFLHDVKDEVTEIRLSGNTFGVEASQALSRVLRDKTHLQVHPISHLICLPHSASDLEMLRVVWTMLTKIFFRMHKWQTYLRDD